MVFETLWTRVSSLWRSESAEQDRTSADSEAGGAGDTRPKDETLSYAEQVEYGVDERELRDEDRVLRLLVKRGGRVDEETIVEETGWSEARLREVVSEMEDEEQVSTITVGRKRVVCRRGFEPKGYRSHLKE